VFRTAVISMSAACVVGPRVDQLVMRISRPHLGFTQTSFRKPNGTRWNARQSVLQSVLLHQLVRKQKLNLFKLSKLAEACGSRTHHSGREGQNQWL
jgi:hypothetical protein